MGSKSSKEKKKPSKANQQQNDGNWVKEKNLDVERTSHNSDGSTKRGIAKIFDIETGTSEMPRDGSSSSEKSSESAISVEAVNTRSKTELADSAKTNEFDIPGTASSEYSETSRITSGSDSDAYQIGIDDDIHAIQSESRIMNMESKNFDTLLYLVNRGTDANSPEIKELIASKEYQEYLKLRKAMWTPRQLYEHHYGNLPGREVTRPQNLEDNIKIDSLKLDATQVSEKVVRVTSSESMTDLSDDDEGWPKYDMNALLEEAAKRVDMTRNPLIATLAEYEKDKNTSGQRVLMSYEFDVIYKSKDRLCKFECLGPDGTRIQDFWTQCLKDEISLIAMFGKFYEKRGVNCARYIPEDEKENLNCGDIIVRRLNEPQYPYDHCKIQKFEIRCNFVPDEYIVWHCERALQDNLIKDYTQENKEFHKLRCALLNQMNTKKWLEHGPMMFSPLRDPMVERNSYVINKEGSNVPMFLAQPIEVARRNPFYQINGSQTHTINVSLSSSSEARKAGGADVKEYFEQVQEYNSDEDNMVSSTDEFSEQELGESDERFNKTNENIMEHYDPHFNYPQCALGSYSLKSEHRKSGIIEIRANGPRVEGTQDFWHMIIEKRIPTIHMTCDYVEEGVSKCAPYIPIGSVTEKRCGNYTIKRLGTEMELSMNLKRQQLLIYETNGISSKHKHSVSHFHEIPDRNVDPIQTIKNNEIINQHVSHQQNPQLLVHGSW